MTDSPNLNPIPENERIMGSHQAQSVVESASLEPLYANFARVSALPEELILDFGLNSNQLGTQSAPVTVSQRVIVNYYNAKRIWMAIGASLQRHEQAFGEIQIDVNKRVIPQRMPK